MKTKQFDVMLDKCPTYDNPHSEGIAALCIYNVNGYGNPQIFGICQNHMKIYQDSGFNVVPLNGVFAVGTSPRHPDDIELLKRAEQAINALIGVLTQQAFAGHYPESLIGKGWAEQAKVLVAIQERLNAKA